MLLHSLEQSTLHLSRSTVNLVSQHEISKNRTLLHLKSLILLAIDKRTHHVGRQKVGSKLNTAKACVNQRSQSLNSQSLSQSRNTFKQNVTISQKAYQQSVHKMFLTHDCAVHTLHKVCNKACFSLYLSIEQTNIYVFVHILVSCFFLLKCKNNVFTPIVAFVSIKFRKTSPKTT